MRALCFLILFLAASQLHARANDVLYVLKDSVNLRGDASTKGGIVLRLKKGDRVVEISRKGSWVKVYPLVKGVDHAWIYSPLVGKNKPVVKKNNQGVVTFNRQLSKLNSRTKKILGASFFSSGRYRGDGIVEVTASDVWLASPRPDRASNARILFLLWQASEGSGLPVFLNIVNRSGKIKMSLP